jgi:DNA-directed RNA polymerase sigma subunit (sigma70/sigma32)
MGKITRDHGLDTYLTEINEVPLLTAAQEIELALRIQQGDRAAREHMIRANLRWWCRSPRTTSTAGCRSWT